MKTISLRSISFAVIALVFVFLFGSSAFIISSLNNLNAKAEQASMADIPIALDQHKKARLIEQIRALLDVLFTVDNTEKIYSVRQDLLDISNKLFSADSNQTARTLMRRIPTEIQRLSIKARTIVVKNAEISEQKQNIDLKINKITPLMEQIKFSIWAKIRSRGHNSESDLLQYKRIETMMRTFEAISKSLSRIMASHNQKEIEQEQEKYQAMQQLLQYLNQKTRLITLQKDIDNLVEHISGIDYLYDLKQENISFSKQVAKEHLALNQNLSALQIQLTNTGVDLAKRVTDDLEYQAKRGFIAAMIVFFILGSIFVIISINMVNGIVKPLLRVRDILLNLKNSDPQSDLLHSNLTEIEAINDAVIRLDLAIKNTEEANKRLITMAQMQSTFTATVSHELRTPLTSIRGFIKIIEKDIKSVINSMEKPSKPANRILSNVNIVDEESKRLSLLINDVLDMTSLSSGRMIWRDETVNPADVIEYTLVAMRGQQQNNQDIIFEKKISPKLPLLYVDPHRLQQVLTNLLHNAFKFTVSGKVILKCWQENNCVYFSISDSGIGIAENDFDRIFEQFEQSGTLKDKPRGTGLGLPICRQIIEHYGGKITVSSSIGHGSTFTFFIGQMYIK